jgi:hypothetical protein
MDNIKLNKNLQIKPIFIFSLPRSGSTLLQSILSSHKEIESYSEPWLLLPILGLTGNLPVLSLYNWYNSSRAINNFISSRVGDESYKTILRDFLTKIYSVNCESNTKYFLDKTPRYYMIIKEIVEIFPDSKFIFLFRNPLDIFASCLKAFHNNHLMLHSIKIDIIEGPKALLEGYNKFKENSIKVNYENFVLNTNDELKKICDYIGIELDDKMLIEYVLDKKNNLFGDKIGINEYNSITSKSIDKWKLRFNSIYSKHIIKRYIRNLEDEYLEICDIKKCDLIMQINKLRTKKIGLIDFCYHIFSRLYCYINKLFINLGRKRKIYKKYMYY